MDDAIRAEWYDLAETDRQAFLDWLHRDYLPKLQARPGILWVGHYGMIERTVFRSTDADGPQRSHTDDPSVSKGGEYLLLIGAASPDVFFDPRRPAFDDADAAGWLARRREHRAAVFIVEARIDGPERRELMPGAGAPPAMQLGNFNVRRPEDEFELGRWYRQLRFPQIAATRGCIGVKKLVSVAGWPKHGVLYEFVSMDADEENFERRFRDADRGEKAKWKGRHVLEYVVHGPGRHAGRRLWPAL